MQDLCFMMILLGGNEITFVSVDVIYHTQQYAISNSRLMQQLGKCENKILKCVFRQKDVGRE